MGSLLAGPTPSWPRNIFSLWTVFVQPSLRQSGHEKRISTPKPSAGSGRPKSKSPRPQHAPEAGKAKFSDASNHPIPRSPHRPAFRVPLNPARQETREACLVLPPGSSSTETVRAKQNAEQGRDGSNERFRIAASCPTFTGDRSKRRERWEKRKVRQFSRRRFDGMDPRVAGRFLPG